MSAVEVLPPVSPRVITRMRAEDADDLDGIHLWMTSDPAMRPLCGAPLGYGHPCAVHMATKETAVCPECGRPVCVYCRLLAP